jgi:mRNA interferase RelE/StbE
VKTRFRASFTKDLQHIQDRAVLQHIREITERIEQARALDEVPNVKKLSDAGRAYRVRVDGIVTFVRALHRKDIYRYFP